MSTEKVMTGTEEPVCTIVMDGETFASDDFVAVLAKPTGDAGIYYNTDAITLGMAMKMVAKAFVDSMAQLSAEDREEVSSILGGEEFDFDLEDDENE